MRVALIALVLVTLLSARAVAADDGEDASPFEAKPTALFLQSGLYSPLGFAGFELEQTVLPVWTVSAGVGLGDVGMQFAGITHLTLGGLRSRLELGAGVSHGDHRWRDLCGDEICAQKTGTVTWANLEIGGAHRWRNGFSLKYFAGYGRIVAGALVCDSYTVDSCVANYKDAGRERIYTGFAFGWAF